MTKQEMDFLSAALDAQDIEHEKREDYSGRAMYGEQTCGIVIDDPTCLIHAVARFMEREPGRQPPEELLSRDEGFRTDDMGLGTIIY